MRTFRLKVDFLKTEAEVAFITRMEKRAVQPWDLEVRSLGDYVAFKRVCLDYDYGKISKILTSLDIMR